MKRRLLAALLLAVMLVTALPLYLIPVSAADTFIEKDYTSVAKIEDPYNGMSATKNGLTSTSKVRFQLNTGSSIVDENGTPISKLTSKADITSNKIQSTALYLEDGETLASSVDYVTVRYRYNYTNSSRCMVGNNMTVLFLWSDGSRDYALSANTVVAGEWAYLNFDFSNMADKAEGVYIEAVRFYFYNRAHGPSTGNQSNSTTSDYFSCYPNKSGSSAVKLSNNDVIEIGAFYYSNTAYYTGEPIVTKYSVTAIADDVTVDTAEIEEGGSYTLPAAPVKENYTFLGWSDGTSTYEAGAEVAITADTTFTALYEIEAGVSAYQVTVKVDGATIDTAELAEGDTYTLPVAQVKDGYNFTGWTDGENTYAAGAEVTINADTTFEAVFAAKVYYNVTVISDGNTVASASVEENTTYKLPAATTKDGYNFIAWSDGENTYAAGASVTITAETTFTATFTEKVYYTVTVVSDGETIATEQIEENTKYTLPAATSKDGYTFIGWSDGTTTYDAGASVAIVGNTTFTAVFEENAVTPPPVADERVLYSNDFSSTDKLNEGEHDSNATLDNGRLKLYSGKETSYNYGYWKKEINVTGAQNDTIYVKAQIWAPSTKASDFVKIAGTGIVSTTYNDLFSVGSASASISENAKTGSGCTLIVTITKSTGAATVTIIDNGTAIIDNVAIDLGGAIGDTLLVAFGPLRYTTRYVDDLSVETLIIKDKYDITAIANGETVESVQVEEDSAYTLPEAPVRYGYDFLGWTDGENTYATGDKVTVKGPMTFTAIYHIQEGMSVVNVTVISDGATLATDPIVTGDTYKLPAAPAKDEHNFMGWSDGTTTYAAGEKVVINADTTFTAVFVPKVYYQVTVESDGTPVDTATIEENYTYTLPAATSKEGYNFKGWSDGKNTYAAGETVTITGNTTFTAVFAIKVYHEVTIVSDGETVATATVEEGTKYTLPAALTKEGYKMSGWSDGVNSYKIAASVVIVGPTTFSAIWLELGDATIIYQNSFTDADDLAEATQMGASVGIDNERAIFYGSDSSWWRKDVNLDNSTGNIVITFKLYPQLLGTYDILSINDVPVLSSYYNWDKTSWPISAWVQKGLRFGAYDASLETAPLNECYAGYNDLNNEAIVKATVNPVTGDTVVNVEYDCGENGKYSFTSETLNVGPCADAKVKIILGMYASGKYFRVDDLLVTQADGQPFAASDVVEREVFDFFFDDFDGEVQGKSSLIAYINTHEGTRIALEDGNKVLTGGATTIVKYPNAFPADTALLSLDFMIPEFPENPSHNDQITIMTDNWTKQNHICIKYDSTLGKWIAGKTTNDLVMSDYAVIEEGKWNHAVILFGKGSYINGEYVGVSNKMGRSSGGQFVSLGGSSYGGGHKNVATYYVDNLYLANERFDRDLIRVTGYQKSDVVDGKYNVRFVCALPTLFEGQTKVGFEISSPSNGKVFDPYETTKVYNSLSANYGTDTITAKSLGAQALVAVAVHGIPEELGSVDLIIKPYVIIDGKKLYGTTVSMNPAGSQVEYDGLFDVNIVDPEETDIVVDPNGPLAGKKVVILIGQSNMAGRGDKTTVELIDDDRLWMYRNGEFIKLAEPVHTDKAEAGTSPGAAFAKAYAETYNEEVVVLPMAVGGTSIDQWSPGNSLFNKTIDAARLAMEQGGEVIAVLWNQGESDGSSNLTRRYVHRFVELVDQLYERLDLDRETVPLIAGQMFPDHPDIVDRNSEKSDPAKSVFIHSNATNINKHLTAATSREGMPALYGIADGSYMRNIGDNTHLDAPSTRVYGYRYFNVYQELVEADANGDGNIDYYDFADPLDLPEDQRTIADVAAVLDSYLINK